jgi:hypothetical protein
MHERESESSLSLFEINVLPTAELAKRTFATAKSTKFPLAASGRRSRILRLDLAPLKERIERFQSTGR